MLSIRVLIVDDSVVVRSRLSKILEADPDLTIAGVAATGKIAIAKVPQVNPDIIILDVEMPDLSGLETLELIRQQYPSLPVIMFSSLTTTGATATIEALTLGASDYVTKPSHAEETTAQIQSTLLPKIKALVKKNSVPVIPVRRRLQDASPSSPEIVAIGVSTGGPNALALLLGQIPPHFPLPIVIVQHMPPMFTKLLAERLTVKCALPVEQAVANLPLRPGTIWLAPGDYHLTVQPSGRTVCLQLDQAPQQNSCRPSVDVLFSSVAEVYGDRSLGVILTGMGQDGLRGCQAIRDRGGQILAQDEASSVVWGMPGFVVNAGIADAVVSIEQMAAEILRRVRPLSFSTGGRANE